MSADTAGRRLLSEKSGPKAGDRYRQPIPMNRRPGIDGDHEAADEHISSRDLLPRDASNDPIGKIQSVDRAASLLELFTPSRPRLTLAEITALLGISKPTAHRYAVALRHRHLLRYDRRTAEYTLGSQILTLAAAARAGLPLITLAASIMEELVRQTNETVVLSVWDGEAPIVVRTDDNTDRFLQINVRVGSRLDNESAQSQVFRAFLMNDRLTDPETTTDDHAELLAIRKRGLALSTPAWHGVRTVAAPVFRDGHIAAVLAIIGTTATVPNDVRSATATAVVDAANALSHRLGDP